MKLKGKPTKLSMCDRINSTIELPFGEEKESGEMSCKI